MNVMEHGTVNHGKVTIESVDPRLLAGDPYYIFNIYGVSDTINTGTTGSFHVPACPEDKEWVRAPQIIPAVIEEKYPHFNDQEHYRARAVPGEEIVAAVLGISKGQKPEEDMRRFGWFISRNSSPSKAELKEANERLNRYLQSVIQEADNYAKSADPALRDSISEKHYRAARRMNIKRQWMTEITALSECPFCSSAIKPGVPKCSNCHEIVSVEAYNALKKQLGTATA